MNHTILLEIQDEAALQQFKDCLYFLYEQSQYGNFMEDGLVPIGYGPNCISFLNPSAYDLPCTRESNEIAFVLLHVSCLQLLVLAIIDITNMADGSDAWVLSSGDIEVAKGYLTDWIDTTCDQSTESRQLFLVTLELLEQTRDAMSGGKTSAWPQQTMEPLHTLWVKDLCRSLFS